MEWVRLTLGHLTTSRKILCNKIHCKIPPDPQLSRVHPSYIVIGSQRPKAYLRIEILEFQKIEQSTFWHTCLFCHNNCGPAWKQSRCPSADVWIRKLWYIHTMEYYSAIKKNSFESVLMRWMKLQPIIQSKPER